MTKRKAGRRSNSEGMLRQRPDGLWEARISLPTGKTKSLYGKTKAEALAKMQKANRAVQDGKPLPPEKLKVAAFLGKWLESVGAEIRYKTFESYSQNVRSHIIPEIGHIRLGDLTAPDIRSMLNKKRDTGLSPRSIQNIHAILRRALGQAEKDNLVPRNVARLVSPGRVKKPDIQPLTHVEAKKLLAAVRGDRLEGLYTVALAVGLRQGEALGLRWQDVNLEAGTLTVRTALQRQDGVYVLEDPKTDSSRRTVKLPDVSIVSLRQHRERQRLEIERWESWGNTWDLVFTSEKGYPICRNALSKRFRRILAGAGIPRHRYHDLRHTCASFLLAQGVDLKVVQDVLGHSQFSTTADIYAHVLPVLMADAAAKMNEALTGD